MAASAVELHPIESELRRNFPSISLESSATFLLGDTFVDSRLAPGLRTSEAERAGSLSLLYPHVYNGLFVAAVGLQRVVLRATGAAGALATESNGKLFYTRPYTSIDVVEVPRGRGSEELLVLHDERAREVFEYEIVAAEGVGAVALDNGAIRFLPKLSDSPATSEVASGRFTRTVPALQIDRPWVIDAWGKRSETRARWTLIGEGSIPKAIRLTVELDDLTFPIIVDTSFNATGSLGIARYDHTATLLPNGKVLIVGGYNGHDNQLTSAELYNPESGTFSATGNLGTAREVHTATLLPDGKVLIASGVGYDNSHLSSAELYDPASGTFSATGNLRTARYGHTATLLPNGKVLFAGGYDYSVQASAELYDPANGTFSATGNLRTARQDHTATLLPNGKVLIAGGRGYDGSALTSAELYDPAGGTFSASGTFGTARSGHTATLLPNGKVLIAGGPSAELYNPASGTFSATGNLGTARSGHTATLLLNGKVLIAGDNGSALTSAELYDPASGTFSFTGSLGWARNRYTATLLANGEVLIAGGYNGSALTLAELYDPGSGGTCAITCSANVPAAATAGQQVSFGASAETTNCTSAVTYAWSFGDGTPTSSQQNPTHVFTAGRYNWTMTAQSGSASCVKAGTIDVALSGPSFRATGSLGTSRYEHTATLLPNGKVLVAGGYDGSYLRSAELYDSAGGSFSTTGSLGTSRSQHTATLLPNGKVLIAGGINSSGVLTSTELYDPASGTFSPTGSLVTARRGQTATLLPNGKVLIAAGGANQGFLTSAELYDPASGAFSTTGSLGIQRLYCTATLLPNGKVLVAGGHSGSWLTSAELYDPASSTFSATGSLGAKRLFHTATLLPSGEVLVVGGGGPSGPYETSAELYDPGSGTFSATGSLGTARSKHSATLLPNGKVLIAGGYSGSYLTSAELYDPASGAFSGTGSLGTARSEHTATLLSNGKALIAGGRNARSVASAELYEATAGSACAMTCSASVPAAATAGQPVSFRATSQATNCTSPVAYMWRFGDGTASSSQQNATHVFTPGRYDWTMTAASGSTSCVKSGTIDVAAVTSDVNLIGFSLNHGQDFPSGVWVSCDIELEGAGGGWSGGEIEARLYFLDLRRVGRDSGWWWRDDEDRRSRALFSNKFAVGPLARGSKKQVKLSVNAFAADFIDAVLVEIVNADGTRINGVLKQMERPIHVPFNTANAAINCAGTLLSAFGGPSPSSSCFSPGVVSEVYDYGKLASWFTGRVSDLSEGRYENAGVQVGMFGLARVTEFGACFASHFPVASIINAGINEIGSLWGGAGGCGTLFAHGAVWSYSRGLSAGANLRSRIQSGATTRTDASTLTDLAAYEPVTVVACEGHLNLQVRDASGRVTSVTRELCDAHIAGSSCASTGDFRQIVVPASAGPFVITTGAADRREDAVVHVLVPGSPSVGWGGATSEVFSWAVPLDPGDTLTVSRVADTVSPLERRRGTATTLFTAVQKHVDVSPLLAGTLRRRAVRP